MEQLDSLSLRVASVNRSHTTLRLKLHVLYKNYRQMQHISSTTRVNGNVQHFTFVINHSNIKNSQERALSMFLLFTSWPKNDPISLQL